MLFNETQIEGAWLVDLQRIGDERGFFARAWCAEEFENHGIWLSANSDYFFSNTKKRTLNGFGA